MFGGDLVFAASVKGQTESYVRRCETRISLQRFDVRFARFTFFALLVESESRDIALLCAVRVRRIGNRAPCGFEIRIVINWRIGAKSQQHAAVFALEHQLNRLTRSG